MLRTAATHLLIVILDSQLTCLFCFVNLPLFSRTGSACSPYHPTPSVTGSRILAVLRPQPGKLAMNDEAAAPMVEDDLQPWERERVDENDDAVFYEHPRLVYHADTEYHQR